MSHRVLIVDDSLTVRMDLHDAFTADGFVTLLCSTGAEARAAFGGDGFDAAVLDVLLPDADGLELLTELRRTPGLGAVVTVLLSTEDEVADRLAGLRTGADEYVGKPYDAGYVVARVRQLLSKPPTPADDRPAATLDRTEDRPSDRPTTTLDRTEGVFLMSDAQATPQPDTYTVLLYSDDLAVRDRIRLAIGTRPAADLAVEFVDASTWEECRILLDKYVIDLMVLDGEAAPAGGLGIARQTKDEYATPPPVCVVLARAADRWLAAYAQVDQTLTYPLDPVTTGQAVAAMLRARRGGAIPLGTLGHLG